MKQLFTSLVALAVLAIAGAAFAAEGTKLATVDLRKIGQDSKAGAEANKALENLTEKLGKNLKKKEAELDKLRSALEGKGKKLSESERSAKVKEFEKKIGAYREAAGNAQKELQDKGEEFAKKLMADMEKVVREYAQKNSYALVIRKADVLYNDGKTPVTDITEEILKIFDTPPPEAAPKK
jgi:outer membrane protein